MYLNMILATIGAPAVCREDPSELCLFESVPQLPPAPCLPARLPLNAELRGNLGRYYRGGGVVEEAMKIVQCLQPVSKPVENSGTHSSMGTHNTL